MKKSETTPRQRAIKDAFQRCLSAESTQIRDEQLCTVEKDDPDLAAEVRALLNAAGAGNAVEQVFGFVSDPKFEATHDSEPQPSTASQKSDATAEGPGTVIGHYKLLEQIGEGGMGAVYMAQQTQPIKRKVALKVIKPGMDTGQVVARFEAERQALALMDHPNIARVLDAGTTKQGRPYFVMELVRGIPITDYCTGHKLTTDARLKLFIDVCHGVQHAHQKGIIHRDLKPSNVLVTLHDGRPVVKIIDFGIAKAMNQDLTDRTLFTNFAQLIGTPLYMSPEQAELSGLDVDTRSDVYSLGVMLYELLTGSTPFDRETLKNVGIEEIRRMIRETDPPKPSQRLSTLKAQAESTMKDNQTRDLKLSQLELQGELDWIVMKSLEKERERRYESASAFAADVQRYLDDESVLACPPSILYRIRKLTRRYRAPLVTAGLLVFMLLAATAVSVRYAYVAEAARKESDKERVKTNDEKIKTEHALVVAAEQSRVADERRVQAEKLEAEAVAQNDIVKRNLYIADMRIAANDQRSGNIARLHKKLNAQVPLPSEKDYRGWEWYYLMAASHQEEMTMSAVGNEQVEWSPDGTKISSIGKSTFARIWNPIDGTLIRTLDLGSPWNSSGVWCPNSEQFAWITGGNSAGARFWDSKTDKVRTLYWDPDGAANGSGAFSIAWSPDGQQLTWSIHGNEAGTRIWDSKSDLIRTPSWRFKGNANQNQENLLCVAWSPDGQRLAAGSADGVLRIMNLANDEVLHEIRGLDKRIDSLSWSPDGSLVACAGNSKEGGVRVWNAITGTQVAEYGLERTFRQLAFARNSAYLIAAGSAGECDIIDIKNVEQSRRFKAHEGGISDLSVSPTEMVFATTGGGGVVRCWSIATADPLATYYGHDVSAYSVAWDKAGHKLVTGSKDDRVKIWAFPYAGKPPQWKWKYRDSNGLISTKTWLYAEPSETEKVVFKGPEFFGELKRLQNAFGEGTQIPDDEAIKRYIESARSGNLPRLTSLTHVPSLDNSTQLISIVWAPDLSRLLTFRDRERKEIDLWSTDKPIKQKIGYSIKIGFDVSWSDDSSRFAIADQALYSVGRVSAYDASTGKSLYQKAQNDENMASVVWNPSGTRLASGTRSGVICVWDAQDGKLLAKSEAHQSAISSLAFSPDGGRIASTSNDGQVRILDSETAEEMLGVKEGIPRIFRLAWNPDGKQLSGLNGEGEVMVWDASQGFDYQKDGWCERDQEIELTKKRESARSDLELQVRFLNSAGKYEESIALATQCLQDDPNSKNLLRWRSFSYTQLERWEMAIKDLSAIALQYPNDSDAYNNLAWIRATCPDGKFRDPAQSVELASRANLLSPQYANSLNTLGVALYRAGNWTAAIAALSKSEELTPDNTAKENAIFLAMSHWQLNQKQEALDWYKKALETTHGKYFTNEESARFQDEATKLLEIDSMTSDENPITPNRKE